MEPGSRPVDVICISDPRDVHWLAVHEYLSECIALCFNLASIRAIDFTSGLDYLHLQKDGKSYTASCKTSVWWRDSGSIDIEDLDEEEGRLAFDEGPHLLIGALEAANTRMIDHPFTVTRAEIKQFQLSVARRLGITVPATQITNDPATARVFAANRRVIAKAVSPGTGIAPYVAEVLGGDLDAIRVLPTMLQELIHASADLRVVVIKDKSWIWRRPREVGTIDWRSVDPNGHDFKPTRSEELSASACRLTISLGLSISVQDWLEVDDDFVFLESNAQGAWLFLPGSRELIAPAMAEHLRGSDGNQR